MEHLLVHPPFADPTQPYVALPTLAAALRARGHDVRVLDLNVRAANWLLERGTVRRLGRQLRGATARAAERFSSADPTPLDVFRTRELFFDRAMYSHARGLTEGWFDALGAIFAPWRFGFNRCEHEGRPLDLALLEEYAKGEASPLEELWPRCFAQADITGAWEDGPPPPDLAVTAFFGISIVFPSQIPEALHLARFVRQRAPQAFVALGGPCIHQVLTHMPPERRARLLAHVHGAGLYEGEETLAELLPRLPAWRDARTETARFELLRDVPHLLLVDPSTGLASLGPRRELDVREAPAPDYSDLDLDGYLAPSRTLLYAPTRGCYWGKCSFCYYGLAETATASYREVPPERAASQLAQLARRHGVGHVYLSCDVLSPKYAVRLAEALVAKRSPIHWSSDLKIERYFTAERCELLYRSGLRSAAFGIETGSDRLLELMRKGSDKATMTAVNRAFHAAGVATQWMAFTDFPSETTAEALDTIHWIEAEREYVDGFVVGRFGLEPGSHVAGEPQRYGVRDVGPTAGDELGLSLSYRTQGGPRSPSDERKIERELARVSERYELSAYPWAGAVSTHHTFLRFLEHGQGAFRTRAPTVRGLAGS